MRSFLGILFVLCLFSCKKDQDLEDIDLGYDYFPIRSGTFIIYEVDSVHYGLTQETFHYQVKEELGDEFTDGEGMPAIEVKRYYRAAANMPWILGDVWTQKRTTNTAERVEENVRFIKMEFPVKEGGTWHGNAYNTLGDWEYKYVNVGKYADVGTLEFGNTLKVEQRNVVNVVDQEIFYEIYAIGIGLVAKQAKDVSYQGGQASGYDVHYSAVAYSTE